MTDERCLLDAGMPPEQAREIRAWMQAGETRKASAALRVWRTALLERLHVCQRQIDCLDYFLRAHKEEL